MQTNIQTAAEALQQADAILIGASNGLSIAEGYHIFATNEMFMEQFGDFHEKFGIRNVIDGCFHDYPSEADRTAFYDRLTHYWVDEYVPSDVMKHLLTIVGEKDYFVITSNADTHLQLSGFDADRVWEIEGTFAGHGKDVEDKNAQLQSFLSRYADKRLVVLELGIGMRNQLIKAPLMRLVSQLPQSVYITLNLPQEIYIPEAIARQSIPLAGDIAVTLQELNESMKEKGMKES